MDNPLPDQLNYFDYDHIAKVFNGGGAHKERDRGERDASDREEPRGRDSRGNDRDAPRSRDRDESEDRGRSGRAAPAKSSRASEEPSWDSIHEMTGDELEDLIDQENLDINPDEAKSDEDLADWICEEMKIKKAPARSGRREVTSDDEDKPASSRLRDMRRGRD